jgi:hypothetical protein
MRRGAVQHRENKQTLSEQASTARYSTTRVSGRLVCPVSALKDASTRAVIPTGGRQPGRTQTHMPNTHAHNGDTGAAGLSTGYNRST